MIGQALFVRENSQNFFASIASLREIPAVQRLGKNAGSYLGETIDVRAVLRDIEGAAAISGWTTDVFFETAEFKFPALHRRGLGGGRNIYISAGIHGDEPAGPLAALHLLQENEWPESLNLWLCPCLNPIGFLSNSRFNATGVDLNRGYLNPVADEILAHTAWLERQPPFDLCLLLHEDWESQGFYLYEQNPDGRPSFAEKMVAAVERVCPIDRSELIDGRPAKDGILRPNVDPRTRPDWPEALYLITHKARQSYTLEAPSDFPIRTRVRALVTAVSTALNAVARVDA